ncbi:DEAD/DEAH box helicase [Faecalibacterium sp. An121]|uniref:DEAD/DEAH box helicase n=1 Tax=Faecalibacterium sp. An121 TaxID=1965550 RepID=UPI000B3739CC|nr:DEAD/DEAH box helicase [Faecalibacterium sp. An121]OUQ35083.1 DEAD/DEAH box helicase [Faecalibacterium sp. An121]
MTFQELNLSRPVLRAVAQAGYKQPSPIQAGAIPPVLKGQDLLGCAQTGTGKTAAFALPMLDLLASRPAKKPGTIRALILTPTRELALQIEASFEQYGKYLPLKETVIFGGVGQAPQVEKLRQGVDILVACPGRLNDLIGQGYVDLSGVEIFVLDEADRMLDMGFVHDVKKVIAKLPARRQNLMFSATMPAEIEQLAAGILRDPAFVKVDPVSSTVDRIDQKLYYVSKADKRRLLPWLIQNLQPPVHNALVFSRTKHGADRIAKDLVKQGIPAAAIHGNKSQSARVAALEGFKAGRTKVLVATDIAARGIDINELSHVFNYDLPEVPETYVHRIGRTARAGADGTAISFCAPEEQEYLAGIEKLNSKKIPVAAGHPWDNAAPPQQTEAQQPVRPLKVRQVQPSKIEKEENIMDESKKSAPRAGEGGEKRSRSRRPRRDGRPKQGQGGQAQPKFDPHFLTGAETAVLPAKAVSAPPAEPRGRGGQQQPARSAKAGGQQPRGQRDNRAQQNAEGKKSQRNSAAKTSRQPEPRAQQESRPARSEAAQGSRGGHPKAAASKSAPAPSRPASRAPLSQPKGRGGRTVRESRDDDPGLVLISRRPPQQKYANFEEYMEAHGGATAPIEDHSQDY